MARPTSLKKRRSNLEKSLAAALAAKNLKDEFYLDRLNQYLEFYDAKTHINSRVKILIASEHSGDRAITDLTAEARRIDAQMMDILKFLGLKPPDEMPPVDGDNNEL